MPRVLLLLPTTTYRTKAFIEAALKIGVDIVAATEQPSTLVAQNPEGLLTLDFFDPERAARRTSDYAAQHKVDAVIPVDEDTAVIASSIAESLDLEHNSVESTRAAKNKHLMREILRRAQVPVPRYWHISLDENPLDIAARVSYPCVIKPVFLSTSRGVMRADTREELVAAIARLGRIVSLPHIARRGGKLAREALIEEFIPGFEVAVEGLVTDGRFRALAIFDKPDPLNGPFFEETIYVTPSRLSSEVRQRIIDTTAAATRAMGMTKGPVHAELRVNDDGPWVIEVAARAIGGLCSRALRFGEKSSLEEVLIRHALGEDVSHIEREARAAGVMMIPVPRSGILREVKGLDEAKAVPDVEDVIISAHITQELQPPPEGASYLGFIFSRADTAEKAEAALREAHSRIKFAIEPE